MPDDSQIVRIKGHNTACAASSMRLEPLAFLDAVLNQRVYLH